MFYQEIKKAIKPLISDSILYKQVKAEIKKAIAQKEAPVKYDWVLDTAKKEALQIELGLIQRTGTMFDLDLTCGLKPQLGKSAEDIQKMGYTIVEIIERKVRLSRTEDFKKILVVAGK